MRERERERGKEREKTWIRSSDLSGLKVFTTFNFVDVGSGSGSVDTNIALDPVGLGSNTYKGKSKIGEGA